MPQTTPPVLDFTLQQGTLSAMVVEACERLGFVLDFLLEELCKEDHLEFMPEMSLADKTEQIVRLLYLREDEEDENSEYALYFFGIIAEISELGPRCRMPVEPPGLKRDLTELADSWNDAIPHPEKPQHERLRYVLEFTITFAECYVGGYFEGRG